MPTYQYSCTECGHFFEIVQSFSEDSLTVCPECEGRLRKVFNAVGVVFKGSGFYRNDSRAAQSSSDAPAKSSSSNGSKLERLERRVGRGLEERHHGHRLEQLLGQQVERLVGDQDRLTQGPCRGLWIVAARELRFGLGSGAMNPLRPLRRAHRRVLLHRRPLAAVSAAGAVLVALQVTSPPPPRTVRVMTASRDLTSGTVLRVRGT